MIDLAPIAGHYRPAGMSAPTHFQGNPTHAAWTCSPECEDKVYFQPEGGWMSYCEIKEHYDRWKEKYGSQDLPDSVGLTQENLDYLSSRFGSYDCLTRFQRMDLLETARKMGIIDSYTEEEAYGKPKTHEVDLDTMVSRRAYSVPMDELKNYTAHSLSPLLFDSMKNGKLGELDTLADAILWFNSVRVDTGHIEE